MRGNKIAISFIMAAMLTNTALAVNTSDSHKKYYGTVAMALSKPSDIHDSSYNDGGSVNNSFQDKTFAMVGLGYYLEDNIRLQLDYSKRRYQLDVGKNPKKTQQIHSEHAMLSLNYDLEKYNVVIPYVMAGVGVATNKAGSYVFDTSVAKIEYNASSNLSVAWMGGVGLGIEFAKGIVGTIGYRYIDMGEAKTATGVTVDSINRDDIGEVHNPAKARLRAQEGMIGVRVDF